MGNCSSYTDLLPFLLQKTLRRLLARMRIWTRSCSQFANKSPFDLCSSCYQSTGLLGNQTGESCCARSHEKLFSHSWRENAKRETARCRWYQHRQLRLRANVQVSLPKTHGFGFTETKCPSSDPKTWTATFLLKSTELVAVRKAF